MSRVLQPTAPTTAPVLPGQQVIAQFPMSTAVNSGDYVYSTANGYGVAASSGSAGIYTQLVGTTVLTTTLASGSLPAFQYGPVAQQGTYSGTTYTQGQVVVNATQLVAAGNQTNTNLTITMVNGNFVFIYWDANVGTYRFQISDPTGAIVAGPTNISGATSAQNQSYRNICAYPLAAGGFMVAYFNYATNYYVFYKKYNASGTLTLDSNIYMGSIMYFNCLCLELANGNFVFAGIDSNQYGLYVVTNSSGAILTGPGYINPSSSYYAGMSTSYYFNAAALTGGGFVFSYYNSSSGQHSISYYSNTGTLLNATSNVPQSIGSLTGVNTMYQRTMSICSTPDNGFAFAFSTGTTIYSYKYVVSGSSLALSATGATVSTGSTTSITTNIFPTPNGGFGLYWMYSDSIPYMVFSTSVGSSITYGTSLNIFSGAYNATFYSSTMFAASANSSQKIGIMFANASGYPQFAILSSIAITNGQTVTGTSFTPPNYLFQGVSLDTVASGQVANVVINGSATLNNNYPSLSTVTPFDFSGTGQFGNLGSVYGRTVTLRGLQI